MGKNKSTGVVSFRLAHEEIAALMRIAEARGVKVNAMLATMMSKRIAEIRAKEEW